MPDFTITDVGESEPWTSKDGKDFVTYSVSYEGDNKRGDARLSRLASSSPPHISEVLENFELGYGKNGAALKRAKDGGKAGGGGSGGSSWKPKSPQELAEMGRMSAQKQALELLAIEVHSGWMTKEDAKGEPLSTLLKKRVDWFYDDIKQAGEQA